MSTHINNLITQELVNTSLVEEDDLTIEEEIESQVDPQEAETALAALKPTLLAIPKEEIRVVKVGTTRAVGVGLAHAKALESDRALFAEAFGPTAFDVAAHDNMADRAKAFWKADIQARQELNPHTPLRDLMAQAKPLRKKMLRAAIYIWGEHDDLGPIVTKIRQGQGYADHADDLSSLATLFAEHWDDTPGMCNVEKGDVDLAERLSVEILRLVSPTRQAEINEARDLRTRAGEYLRQGIDNIRRAALFIFHNDKEQLQRYPNLFLSFKVQNSKGKEKKVKGAEAAPAEAVSAEPSQTNITH